MSTRNLFLPLTLIAALHATAPAIVLSQENNDNPEQLAPISITATRNPIRTFEYPGMVSVIGGEAIHAGQPSTSDDILRAVPNLEFTGGPRRSGETPSLRGFDGPDIVILLDGARQNFGAAHDGRFFLDPSLLREVEVLRGPASSLYGSGGTGGVIEFRTVDARDLLAADESAGVTVTVGHQSVNDERSATFLGYARPTMALDFIGAVTKRESGDIQLGDGNALTDTEDDILSALIKGGWDFNEHHRLESSLQRFANDAKEPNNGQGAGGADIVAKDIRADNWRLAYRYTNPAAALLDLDIVAYRTETQADERRLDANGAGPVGELLRRDMDTTGLRIDNRSRLPSAHGIATTFTYGGEIYRDEQDGAAGEGERDGVPDAEADYRGLFAQAEMVIGEPLGMLPGDLSIVAGLRHDSFEMSSPIAANAPRDSERSPRLSASYLPTDWLMFFASYAEAFRAATLDERFLTGTHFVIPIGPGATIVNRFIPNPELRPQRTETLEIGGGLTFENVFSQDDLLEFKAAYFETEGEDFIDLGVNQPAPFTDCNPFIAGACDGTTTSVNVARAILRGVEIESGYENPRLRITLALSTLNGKNEDTGQKLGVLTPPQLHLDTALKWPAHDTRLGWRLHAADEFDDVNSPDEQRAGYAVHDFYFAWTPGRSIRLDLGIDNAFDKAYSRVFTGATEAGRNIKATLRYDIQW